MFVKMETNVSVDNSKSRPVYLDHASTTPVDPEVAALVMHYMVEEFGNAGSRTHVYGAAAAKAVQRAREQVAEVVSGRPDDVIFTSGATEANNLAILGLAEHGLSEGRRHIVSTQIEHKAVLEPLEEMERRGFEVTLVAPERSGRVSEESVLREVREDTLLVSVMTVNNETGVIQPVVEIAEGLSDGGPYFHTDAAQAYAKLEGVLCHPRIDMISVSGHKIRAPKGVGSLILKRRQYRRAPIKPLLYGGGQERGLRPGTLPVQLIAAMGLACQKTCRSQPGHQELDRTIQEWMRDLDNRFGHHGLRIAGESAPKVGWIRMVSVDPSFDSEALIIALKDVASVSNGSACTSTEYTSSHVLHAMGADHLNSFIRLSQ